MNNVNILGRITSDLNLETVGSGTTICKFSVAYNEKYKGEEKAHFFNVTAFGGQAEFITKWCKKGGRVAINGKLTQDRWETKEGDKRSSVNIICMNCTPVDWDDNSNVNSNDNPVPNTPDDNPFSYNRYFP